MPTAVAGASAAPAGTGPLTAHRDSTAACTAAARFPQRGAPQPVTHPHRTITVMLTMTARGGARCCGAESCVAGMRSVDTSGRGCGGTMCRCGGDTPDRGREGGRGSRSGSRAISIIHCDPQTKFYSSDFPQFGVLFTSSGGGPVGRRVGPLLQTVSKLDTYSSISLFYFFFILLHAREKIEK